MIIIKKYLVVIILLIGILFIGISVYIYNKKNNSYNFKIYFFNAGKADAMIISNNDRYIMIDTGTEDLSDEILSYLKDNNINKLDYLIITHFDKDHVGSASKIIDSIDVENVFQSNVPTDSKYYNNYISSLKSNNIEPQIITGDYEFILGDLNVVVNGPNTIYDKNESNNSSLIVSINYNNTNYLFMGDSENARIKDFLKENNNTYEFIKIPYHGHYQKRLNDLLEGTKPMYAVITSSENDMEDEETLDLLSELDIKYYLTRKGSITILSDGDNIKIKQE